MREYADRADAGRRVAAALLERNPEAAVVLGLPRGGVPVAAVVAEALHAPLDVLVVRKLGAPGRPELAVGAIAEGGIRVLDERLAELVGASAADLARIESVERRVLEERLARLRPGGTPPDLGGRTAIIVDDGIATGATATAAARAARAFGASRVIVAAPVGGRDAATRVEDADEVICLLQPDDFAAVGAHYADFRPTTDDEVLSLLPPRSG